MKPIDLFRTASSNMWRSKLRSALTIIAIFIGAFTLTLTNGIGDGVSSYIDKQLGGLGAENVLLVRVKTEDPLSGTPQEYDPKQTVSTSGFAPAPVLSDADIEVIRSVPGILSAEPLLAPAPDYIEGKSGKKFKLNLQPYIEGTVVNVAVGESLDNNSSEKQILLSISFAEALGFSPIETAIGQNVTIGVSSANGEQRQVEARVAGVQKQSLLSTASGGQSNTALTKALRSIQIEGLPPAQANQHLVGIARFDANISESELQTIKDNLEQKGLDGRTVEDQIGIFKQVIDAIIAVLNLFAAIALLAASFGVINTLFMAVQERTKEIGLMKAMGMRRGKVFALFSIEAILLGFWGSLLGSLAGIGVGQLINRIAADTFLKDLPDFKLLVFSLTSVLTIMFIVMTIAFMAGTLPARRASRKDPIEALRYE